MAKPTHHSELGRLGFKLVGESDLESRPGIGGITRRHYTLNRQTVGNGNIVRPITHHVVVDEYGKFPGKYDVAYFVDQDNEPYSSGDYDWASRHKANSHGGSPDPIRDIMGHHNVVSRSLDQQVSAPPLENITHENVHSLVPKSDSWSEWDQSSDRGIRTRLRHSPEYGGLISLNSSPDEFDDIIRGNNYSGNCAMCGKAVRNIPESSFRDDKLYQVHPEDETSDMHGPPVNLCGTCSVNPDVTTAIRKNPKSFGWHWNDQGVPGCPECEAHLMDQADEDLRP